MNVCSDQLLLSLADPEQILGLSAGSRAMPGNRLAQRRERYPRLSGGAEDVLVLKPDIVVASLFDKRSTRELLKANGTASRRIRRAADARRGEGPDSRDSATSSAIPIARRRQIARLDAALSRARQAVADNGIIACCRCRGAAGWRAATVLSARCWPKPDCSTRPAISVFSFGGFASLEAIVQPEAGFAAGLAGRRSSPATTARRFCCIRRWSGSIRRKNAS